MGKERRYTSRKWGGWIFKRYMYNENMSQSEVKEGKIEIIADIDGQQSIDKVFNDIVSALEGK